MSTILLAIGAILALALLYKLFIASMKLGCGCLLILIVLIFILRGCFT